MPFPATEQVRDFVERTVHKTLRAAGSTIEELAAFGADVSVRLSGDEAVVELCLSDEEIEAQVENGGTSPVEVQYRFRVRVELLDICL